MELVSLPGRLLWVRQSLEPEGPAFAFSWI